MDFGEINQYKSHIHTIFVPVRLIKIIRSQTKRLMLKTGLQEDKLVEYMGHMKF